MLNRIFSFMQREPAIIAALAAIVSQVILTVTEVITLNGGEWATIVAAILTAAGVTRSQVSPVD